MISINSGDLRNLQHAVKNMTEKAVLEMSQKITLDVHANLVTASPVDTGNFRGAWTVETPQKAFDEGVIENTTEYGPALVNGHSTQASTGWVDNAIEAATRL